MDTPPTSSPPKSLAELQAELTALMARESAGEAQDSDFARIREILDEIERCWPISDPSTGQPP